MQHRIPSLDGLRAISILLVLFSHYSIGSDVAFPPAMEQQGFLGVRIFFVISGYLITSLLLNEQQASGRIDLVRFYFRRTLRIFPAYYVFLIVTCVLIAWEVLPLAAADAPSHARVAFLYLSNFFYPGSWFLAHTWSLSVEEQFYLLWPVTLTVLGRARSVRILVWLTICLPLFRFVLFAVIYAFHLRSSAWIESTTPFESIAAGCLLASCRVTLHQRTWYRAILYSRAFLIVPIIILIMSIAGSPSLGGRFAANLVCVFTLMNLAIAMVIDRVITCPPAFLNFRPLMFLGALSYSIYLWQQLFLGPRNLNGAFWWIVASSLASYFLIEKPALRLRRWYEARAGLGLETGREGA